MLSTPSRLLPSPFNPLTSLPPLPPLPPPSLWWSRARGRHSCRKRQRWVHTITCSCRPQTHRMRSDPGWEGGAVGGGTVAGGSSALGVAVRTGRGLRAGGGGVAGTWDISGPASSFSSKPKTALKRKLNKKQKAKEACWTSGLRPGPTWGVFAP